MNAFRLHEASLMVSLNDSEKKHLLLFQKVLNKFRSIRNELVEVLEDSVDGQHSISSHLNVNWKISQENESIRLT